MRWNIWNHLNAKMFYVTLGIKKKKNIFNSKKVFSCQWKNDVGLSIFLKKKKKNSKHLNVKENIFQKIYLIKEARNDVLP